MTKQLNKPCILFGSDSSTKSTAISIFENGIYKTNILLDLSNIKGKANNRIPVMVKDLYKIINTHNPDIIVLETPVVVRNAQAQRDLSMLAGCLWGKCIELDIDFNMLRPTEWRSLISKEKKGNKREELKAWSKQKVNDLYGLEVESDDISDAILIGQAYINYMKSYE